MNHPEAFTKPEASGLSTKSQRGFKGLIYTTVWYVPALQTSIDLQQAKQISLKPTISIKCTA